MKSMFKPFASNTLDRRAPHDVEAMDVEEFTMEGRMKVKIGEVLVK